ncbi:MAG: replicative DNA helicase [Nitrospirae bacterium]|nr:replicative DNA helicase [Nitrospirota bacterium]MBF0540018.1 replicative DNA helicase [Nitrospirota bacterium]
MKQIEDTIDKLPPQNLEAEQTVLGAIMLENTALYKTIEVLKPNEFYRESHRKIYKGMLELLEKNEPIDLITLSDHLRKKNELEAVGGASYLSSLVNSVPTTANVVYHSKIISSQAVMRSLISAATDIISKVYEGQSDADEMLDFAEKTIFAISEQKLSTSFTPLNTLIKDSFEHIEQLYDRRHIISGIPSGFKDLDELTTGFQEGDLIIIGGRPSMGKTALCLNIAQYSAKESKMPVAIFSLEMSKRQLAMRMLCSEANVDSNSIRKGIIKKSDWHKLTSAASNLGDAPIYIDDSSDITALEMRAKARRLKLEHGLGLIIVDYLQLMRGRGGAERREQEISEISRSLKSLARELSVPVIALSQLNRAVESRKPKPIPNLSDLRESGAIEQDADLILFLFREEVYNKEAEKGKAELIIAKQRNGPTGEINLSFISSSTKFANYAPGDYTVPEYEVDEETF